MGMHRIYLQVTVVYNPALDVGPAGSSSSEQSAASFIGFIPRNSDALGEYLEKIRHASMHQMPSERGLCLVRVLLRAYKEGVFEDGACKLCVNYI